MGLKLIKPLVIQEQTNHDSIRKWMEPTVKTTLPSKCPKCDKDLTGIKQHNCPMGKQ